MENFVSHAVILALAGTGYVLLLLFDMAQLYHRRALAVLSSTIGYLCVTSASIFLVLSFRPFPAPVFLQILLLCGAAAGVILMVLSLFVHLPQAEIYAGTPASTGRRAAATGLYALARHPFFLSYTLFLASFGFLFRDASYNGLALAMLAMELVLVTIEDLVIFPRLFENYAEYQEAVPMLVPWSGRGRRGEQGPKR